LSLVQPASARAKSATAAAPAMKVMHLLRVMLAPFVGRDLSDLQVPHGVLLAFMFELGRAAVFIASHRHRPGQRQSRDSC
jgi:hypothetical protein